MCDPLNFWQELVETSCFSKLNLFFPETQEKEKNKWAIAFNYRS